MKQDNSIYLQVGASQRWGIQFGVAFHNLFNSMLLLAPFLSCTTKQEHV